MRIFFIGCVEFSKNALLKLIELNADIIGVATKQNSKVNSDFYDLSEICHKSNIPVKYIKNINSEESLEWIRSLSPDIIFCFGWSYLISCELLKLPQKGIVGFHPAELPHNRGRHPIIWALALGLKKTATTFFFMDEGADSGDILSQKAIAISESDDAYSLYNKITSTALLQIEEFLPQLINNSFIRISQDHKSANLWRKRNQFDGKIDWRMSKDGIYNLVRALTKPYIGAHIIHNGNERKIWKVIPLDHKYEKVKNFEPGKIIAVNSKENYFDVKCYDGLIRIIDHDFEELPNVGDYLLNE